MQGKGCPSDYLAKNYNLSVKLALHYRKQKTFATELFHKFSYITSGAKYFLTIIALNHWDTFKSRYNF